MKACLDISKGFPVHFRIVVAVVVERIQSPQGAEIRYLNRSLLKRAGEKERSSCSSSS